MSNDPVIITAAITGAEVTREKCPHLPISPDEQAEAAYECWKAGASVVHLHIRDKKGRPSQKVKGFEEVIHKIRNRCDIIIQISTGGAVGEKFKKRLAPLSMAGEFRPAMASLNMGSINFGDEVFQNLPSEIEALIIAMNSNDIKPELEIYDVGMLEYSVKLLNQGLIKKPAHFQFVLGTSSGLAASEDNLDFLLSKLPPDSTWTGAGVGRHQLLVNSLSLNRGGHIRIGFEDNIYLEKGVLADSNAQMVERIVEMAKESNRPIASAKEARKILSIHPL